MTTKLFHILLCALLTMPIMAHAQEEANIQQPAKKAVKMDVDNDGAVSKAEFMSAQEERFAKMDTNSDLKITEDEYKAAAQKWRDARNAARQQRAETPKDGNVDAEEVAE